MPKLEPMPSPRSTNHERLFIMRLPRGMALDQLPRELRRLEHRETNEAHDEPEHGELHRRLTDVCSRHLSGGALAEAQGIIDHHLGMGKYDRAVARKYGDGDLMPENSLDEEGVEIEIEQGGEGSEFEEEEALEDEYDRHADDRRDRRADDRRDHRRADDRHRDADDRRRRAD